MLKSATSGSFGKVTVKVWHLGASTDVWHIGSVSFFGREEGVAALLLVTLMLDPPFGKDLGQKGLGSSRFQGDFRKILGKGLCVRTVRAHRCARFDRRELVPFGKEEPSLYASEFGKGARFLRGSLGSGLGVRLSEI
ncbi:hypothetical protein L3X38_019028 [Prunus dulcis]|uniref:Uncharacterized protein n=1 Tax=Prunus dulcis TaxID=3755 RepID=A0AAD4ZBK7_PRUDU|nr:hypothetical protein L3X38_019028 [Prunus dulcis]